MDNYLYHRSLNLSSGDRSSDNYLFIVNELSDLFDLNLDTTFALTTILTEAIDNAFVHGNNNQVNLDVVVSVSVNLNHIVIEVEDQGNGFNINDIPSPIVYSNLRKESGRGLFFIKSLSSSLDVLGKGNILRIIVDR